MIYRNSLEHLSSNFLGSFLHLRSLDLRDTGSTLGSEGTTSPVSSEFIVPLVEVGLNGFKDLVELTPVRAFDRSESDASASLPVDESSQTSLALHNAVRDSHLPAQCWDVQNQLNGIDIMSDDHKLSFFSAQ